MSDSNVSFATPTEAIRVFCGFPNAQLTEPAFFTQLGQTFMPGTPYMLQPLGLAAYLPGVLSAPAQGLPHEFALICYPSQGVWDMVMHQTLRGRVYNQTHGGVYAQPQSTAAFPVFIDHLPPLGADPFFLFPDAVDWQAGVTYVVVGGKKDTTQSGNEFRTTIRKTLLDERDVLRTNGITQVIGIVRDSFAVVWFHCESPNLGSAATSLNTVLNSPTTLRHERVVCNDEPPTLLITGSQAFNFIFLREQGFFLR